MNTQDIWQINISEYNDGELIGIFSFKDDECTEEIVMERNCAIQVAKMILEMMGED